MTAVMFIFGALTVLSACGVVFAVKTLHSALYLIMTLFLVAVHFALMGADFIAALQVLVYAGAIMVLVIFVILLLGLNEKGGESGRMDVSGYLSVIVTGAFVGMMLYMVEHPGLLPGIPDSNVGTPGHAAAIGHELFTKFLYPFEVTSLLLLAAIIGAVVLAYEPKRALPAGRGLKAKRTELAEESEQQRHMGNA